MQAISPISRREKQVLHLIASEYTTPEIAIRLSISHNTVQTHRKNLLSKFKAKNIAGLVFKGVKYGVLEI